MNNFCRLLIILLITLLCLITFHEQSFSANWVYIATNNDTKFYVDIDSIKVNYKAHTIQFWEKHVYPTGSRVALDLCDYDEKSYVSLFLTEYDGNGKVIFSGRLPRSKMYVIPGSMFEKILDDVLKLKGIK